MKTIRIYHRRLMFERFEQRLLLTVIRQSPLAVEQRMPFDVAQSEFPGDQLARGVWEYAARESNEQVQPREAAVKIRLDLTDSRGLPVSAVEPGDQFTLNVFVTDQRQDARGVFAAYLDVHFDADRVELDGELVFDGLFTNVVSGESARGLLDEVGATVTFPSTMGQTASPFMGAMGRESLLFHAPFRAIGSGSVTFRAEAADVLPFSDVLVLGVDQPLSPQQIQFGSASVDVIDPTSFAQTTDKQAGFGSATPRDPPFTLTSVAPAPRPADLFPQDLFPLETTTAAERRGPSVDLPTGKPIDPPSTFDRPRTADSERTERGRSAVQPFRPSGDFLELEIVPRSQPNGSSKAMSDSAGPPDQMHGSSPTFGSAETRPTVPQGWFDRDFQRITWGGDTSSNVQWIDITEAAYHPIRSAERFDDGDLPRIRDLADDDLSDSRSDDEGHAHLDAIDTLFALGVELKPARSWELAMEFASDDDEGESSEVEEDEAAGGEEADAGPPQPEREARESDRSSAAPRA